MSLVERGGGEKVPQLAHAVDVVPADIGEEHRGRVGRRHVAAHRRDARVRAVLAERPVGAEVPLPPARLPACSFFAMSRPPSPPAWLFQYSLSLMLPCACRLSRCNCMIWLTNSLFSAEL